MAYATQFTNNESKAFDYANVYTLLGYETTVILDEDGSPCLTTMPQLSEPFEIAMKLPEHKAPEAWM